MQGYCMSAILFKGLKLEVKKLIFNLKLNKKDKIS
jgi:hypothetical protein